MVHLKSYLHETVYILWILILRNLLDWFHGLNVSLLITNPNKALKPSIGSKVDL